ncbi:hypothetical protein, partial [Acidovorax sp.]|uniref:hypothetical protein n=1 Tax=Acidovorax sp. TaxID=1872122 RepID=UPI0025BC5C7F
MSTAHDHYYFYSKHRLMGARKQPKKLKKTPQKNGPRAVFLWRQAPGRTPAAIRTASGEVGFGK